MAVLRNAGSDFRVSYLHEKSASAHEQRDHLAADAPEGGIDREKTVSCLVFVTRVHPRTSTRNQQAFAGRWLALLDVLKEGEFGIAVILKGY